MAFPVIEGTTESSTNTAGNSHAITLPASIAASDLVLIIVNIGTTGATFNALTDWTELLDEAGPSSLKIIYYTGTGVPSNPTFTSSANTRSASIAYRISGVNKAIAPQIGTTSAGTGTTPDPPASAAPSSTKDYLFIAFFGANGEELDDDTWSDTPPTNYTPTPPLQKACGTGGVNLGGLIAAASRQLNTGAAEDPGTFAKDVSADWRAQTIMIHPIVDTTVTPDVLALVISPFAPTVTATQHVSVTPTTLAHTIATFAPQLQLKVIPGVAALTLSTFAPTVTGASGFTVTPSTAALTTTTFAPQIQLAVIPATTSLTTSTFAPQIRLGIIPPTASLTLSTFAPTVIVTDHKVVVPTTATLTLNTFAPQLKHGISPGTAALTTTALAPQLKLGIIPPTTALSLTTFAPTVNVGAMVVPGVAALTTTGFVPQLQLGIIPPTLALTLTTFTPDVAATGGVVTIVPGIEYTSAKNRLHYTSQRNRLHYTTGEED